MNVLTEYQVIYGCVYACSCLICCLFCFKHKYIITVSTYQSFGVHVFSTVLVHIENMLEPLSLPRFHFFVQMIGFSTHTINQIKGSHALISTYFLAQKTRFIRNLGILPETRSHPLSFQHRSLNRGCNWHEFQEAPDVMSKNDVLMFRGAKDWFVFGWELCSIERCLL